VALPGSPFPLYVAPSTAHAPSTSLPQASLQLKGTVGESWTCSCTLFASDRMGNRCVTGGAPIKVDVDSPSIFESQCTDNGDGSYTLEWRGMVSGTYTTQVRIDGVHVIGSPTTVKMLSGPPDVPKCEISGLGLKSALAGQYAKCYITCKDRFSNPLNADSLQGASLSFGLALLAVGESKATRETVESMPFDGRWVKDEDVKEERAPEEVAKEDDKSKAGESFEIQYTAEEAGDFELHVWCDPDGSDTRQWLTGSPFLVRVTGVRPSREGSFVSPPEEDHFTAGDVVNMQPQLRDQFGNASAAVEGSFEAKIHAPDGVHDLELKTLKGLGLYECAYDLTIKGSHSVHFLLNGADISGSPVTFNVNPGAALGSKSRLYPPSEPPQINQPCELRLEAVDKFGNMLEQGGSRVDARANGPGVSACTVDDRQDGTYTVTFSAAVVGETRVIVRLDNVEMQPLKLVFVEGKGGGDGGGKRGGKGGKPGGGNQMSEAAEAPGMAAPAPSAPVSAR